VSRRDGPARTVARAPRLRLPWPVRHRVLPLDPIRRRRRRRLILAADIQFNLSQLAVRRIFGGQRALHGGGRGDRPRLRSTGRLLRPWSSAKRYWSACGVGGASRRSKSMKACATLHRALAKGCHPLRPSARWPKFFHLWGFLPPSSERPLLHTPDFLVGPSRSSVSDHTVATVADVGRGGRALRSPSTRSPGPHFRLAGVLHRLHGPGGHDEILRHRAAQYAASFLRHPRDRVLSRNRSVVSRRFLLLVPLALANLFVTPTGRRASSASTVEPLPVARSAWALDH